MIFKYHLGYNIFCGRRKYTFQGRLGVKISTMVSVCVTADEKASPHITHVCAVNRHIIFFYGLCLVPHEFQGPISSVLPLLLSFPSFSWIPSSTFYISSFFFLSFLFFFKQLNLLLSHFFHLLKLFVLFKGTGKINLKKAHLSKSCSTEAKKELCKSKDTGSFKTKLCEYKGDSQCIDIHCHQRWQCRELSPLP